MAAILVDAAVGYQVRARDSERVSDVDSITRSLERYYRTQAAVTGPSYPASTVTIDSLGAFVDNPDAIIAPGQSGNSLVVATNNGGQNPTINQYIYQPLQVNGALCTTTPCPRYKVYYRTEVVDNVITKESLRQQ